MAKIAKDPSHWWHAFPLAANPGSVTDQCDGCGHVRDRHVNGLCWVARCECINSETFRIPEYQRLNLSM